MGGGNLLYTGVMFGRDIYPKDFYPRILDGLLRFTKRLAKGTAFYLLIMSLPSLSRR